jgi:hypothetical protein
VDSEFVDLDILLTRIRHPQSKVYFLDAVKAYKAGALRGALTSAWVALVYDLIAKYRELSATGERRRLRFFSRGITRPPQATSPSCSSLREASSKTQRPTHRSSTASPEPTWTAFVMIDIFALSRRSRPRRTCSNHLPNWCDSISSTRLISCCRRSPFRAKRSSIYMTSTCSLQAFRRPASVDVANVWK